MCHHYFTIQPSPFVVCFLLSMEWHSVLVNSNPQDSLFHKPKKGHSSLCFNSVPAGLQTSVTAASFPPGQCEAACFACFLKSRCFSLTATLIKPLVCQKLYHFQAWLLKSGLIIISPAVWYKPRSAFKRRPRGELRPAANSVLSSCHNEDTHHIGCAVAQEEQITIKGEPRIWRLGFCQMGNLIRGHFMHRKYVSLLVREWFIWTVILGSCSRPQLIASGKEVYDKSLTSFFALPSWPQW